MEIKCKWCGKMFHIPKCREWVIKYCSKECKYKSLNWVRSWRLVATWEEKRWKNNKIYVKCVCDCWKETRVQRRHIMHKTILSCWCYATEIKRETWKKNTTHWMTKTRLYSIYDGIKYRCWDVWTANMKWYALRWIKNERKTFEDFLRDMWPGYYEHVETYWEKNTQIDRIDVNWNYCKENCRWVTIKEQQNNRRSNHSVYYKWVYYKSVKMLCDELWLPYARTLRRINNWWDICDAIEIPKIENSIKLKWHDFIIKSKRNENNINIMN